MVRIDQNTLNFLNAGEKPVKKNKHRNIRIIIDGIKFQSIKEAERYSELKLQEHCGFISDLERQPVFLLQDKFKHNAKSYRDIRYFADFKYIKDGKEIIEDVKAWDEKKQKFIETDVFKLKKKMLLKRYPGINFIIT